MTLKSSPTVSRCWKDDERDQSEESSSFRVAAQLDAMWREIITNNERQQPAVALMLLRDRQRRVWTLKSSKQQQKQQWKRKNSSPATAATQPSAADIRFSLAGKRKERVANCLLGKRNLIILWDWNWYLFFHLLNFSPSRLNYPQSARNCNIMILSFISQTH